MNGFRYWRDGLCLAACAAYAINRWLVKPWLGTGFFHDHFNDLLLIPAALPLLLWIQHLMKLRLGNAAPSWSEIFGYTALWSILFEVIGPQFLKVTGDWIDAIAYFVGAILAGFWWRRSMK